MSTFHEQILDFREFSDSLDVKVALLKTNGDITWVEILILQGI